MSQKDTPISMNFRMEMNTDRGIFNNSFSSSDYTIILKAPNADLIREIYLQEFAPEALSFYNLKPEKITHGIFKINSFKMYPFQYKELSVPFYYIATGFNQITIEIKKLNQIFTSEKIIMVMPRPVQEVPVTPSDIVSYLGDKARENCDTKYPCSKSNQSGFCLKNHPDNHHCVVDENRRLFSGCEEYEDDYKTGTLNRYYACLMKKHGFK
jgi:hypothetical protein